jgi:hypothetical protein
MKLLSRILVPLLVLLGIAFLVVHNRAYADLTKCQGVEAKLGLDDKNCENGQPLQIEEPLMKDLLDMADVKEECYRLRTYKDHIPEPYRGTLDLLVCTTTEGTPSQKVLLHQPNGSGQTQRIMFNTQLAKDRFERVSQAMVQAAKPSPSPGPKQK